MELNQLGAQFIRIRVNDDDITEAFAGVMGDTNTRSFSIELMAENGEILADPDTHLKLLIRQGDGKELLFSDGTYDNSGKYKVQIPNEVFTKEQEITCQFVLEKNGDKLYSHTFKRKVAAGLLGTTREGKTTMLDLERIMFFGNRYEELMKELNQNADDKLKTYNENDSNKTELYNKNATTKIEQFNENYSNKTSEYNKNAEEKTTAFNKNFTSKKSDFDENAKNKTELYNKNHGEKVKEVESIKNSVESTASYVDSVKGEIDNKKQNFDNKKQDFDNKYAGIVNIVNTEEQRVEAEKERQVFDEKLKKIFNEGMDAELGEYAKKTDLQAAEERTNQKLKDDSKLYVKKTDLVFEDADKKYIGVFKVIDGNPVIELKEMEV